MLAIFLDALIDTSKMIPLLLIIYAGIELIEHNYGRKLTSIVQKADNTGPALGAVFGCVPQCGFSVISTALYTRRVITLGTLLAVYISTSDEAIPVILSQPNKAGIILPLIITKVIIAIIAGYAIDFILKNSNKTKKDESVEREICATSEEGCANIHTHIDKKGCCGHSCNSEKAGFKELIIHPIKHTLKVFIFIFATSLLINFIIFKVGEENLGKLFLGHSVLQPVLAALVGLIPNCAASVAITEVFLKGGISFGSTIAGLSASAGLGMLVLFKENKDLKDTLRIIGLLFGISTVAGIAIQYFYG